jgi:iron(III) transport system ATP-binding protein
MSKSSVPVRIESVTKVFKDVRGKADVIAVNEADFEIGAGELVTLLGPSGCGKTTTLRMIGGFELPTKGRIFLGNEDITFLPPNKRDTATVFQSYGLFPHMNVFDNVAYGLKLRRVPTKQIKEKVMKTLDLVGLGDLAQRAPSKLSGGQQQRVALARSLIVEPSVLLLDEPLSNLDALLREQMRVEIKRIQRSLGITAIYVTHDRVEAMSLSDRIIVMKDGFIRQIGSPDTIYENPNSKFVAGFVGKVAFLPVEVLETTGKCTVKFEDKIVEIVKFSSEIKRGDKAVIMARPESLKLLEPGSGIIEGQVNTNIYLGGSLESFVTTDQGEILVQIDNPAEKKVFAEGAKVSIGIIPNLVKALPDIDN